MALSCCLPLLSTACAQRAQILRPDPPPPDLVVPCVAGPDYPAGDAALDVVLEVVRLREEAAAIFRARHRGLVAAWPTSAP